MLRVLPAATLLLLVGAGFSPAPVALDDPELEVLCPCDSTMVPDCDGAGDTQIVDGVLYEVKPGSYQIQPLAEGVCSAVPCDQHPDAGVACEWFVDICILMVPSSKARFSWDGQRVVEGTGSELCISETLEVDCGGESTLEFDSVPASNPPPFGGAIWTWDFFCDPCPAQPPEQ